MRNRGYSREAADLRAELDVVTGRRREGTLFGAVRPKTASRWRIDVRPFGWISSLAGEGFRSPEEAELVLRKIRGRIRSGMSAEAAVAPFLTSSSAAARVATHYERWLEAKRREVRLGRLSPRTLQEYARYARPQGEIGWWDSRSIYEIDEARLEDWSFALAERCLAPKTIRNVLGAFRSFTAWLVRRGGLERVPLFPVVRLERHAPRVLELEDQVRILEAIPTEERGALLVLATMGLRPGEVRALMPADYVPGRGRDELATLRVERARQGLGPDAPVGPTKTHRARVLPVPPAVSAWIEDNVNPRERLRRAWLFVNPRTGAPWSHWALRQAWLRGCRAAGVAPVPLYEGTKHTAASAMLERSGNLEVVAAMLGHTDVRTTRLYAQARAAALVELMGGSVSAGAQAVPKPRLRRTDGR